MMLELRLKKTVFTEAVYLITYVYHLFAVHKSRRDALKLFLPECSEEEVQEKEDSSKKLKRTSPPDIVDQKELIAFLRNDKKIGCLCMIYAVSRASVLYSPYCLTYVIRTLNIA
jgi:hypothetical protein